MQSFGAVCDQNQAACSHEPNQGHNAKNCFTHFVCLFGLHFFTALITSTDASWATFIFGLCAADLTARTGSIAAAWGFHFANNRVALLAISLPGSISGLALYLTPFRAEDTEVVMPMILLDIPVTILIWAVLRRALQR